MKKLEKIYQRLYDHYGDLHWWPADTPFEIIVGAILTQNTAWTNVEKALANFDENLSPEFILSSSPEELQEMIRPAGFYKQKSQYLKAVTAWFMNYRCDVNFIKKCELHELRSELLNVKGVGPETADSILLYAFDLPTFVVDAYTRRLFDRIPIPAGKTYSEIKQYCEMNLPKDNILYNRFHALIVQNGKEHCRKKPVCQSCPLEGMCGKKIE